MTSRQRHSPQTNSALDYCIHKYDTEGGNMTISPQQLLCRNFYAFYYHHPCLAQMRLLSARYSATTGMLGNWQTNLHAHEGHGYFSHPLHCLPRCARFNTMKQCAIIPDKCIIASNIPKQEGKGLHMTLLFSRTSLVELLMVLKESPV